MTVHTTCDNRATAWTVGHVCIDGGGPRTLAQYDDRNRWNGWLMPLFDAHSVQLWIEHITREDQDDFRFSWDTEDFVLTVINHPGTEDEYCDVIAPDDDGLYEFGPGWVWEFGVVEITYTVDDVEAAFLAGCEAAWQDPMLSSKITRLSLFSKWWHGRFLS